MANTFRLKRSAVQGKVPTTGDLQLGELALNTYDGKLYTLKDNGSASVVEIGAGGGGAGVTDGDKGDITVSSSGTVWTLDSISGDIPNTATGYFQLPVGTTGQRAVGATNGWVRYNSTLGCIESYVQGGWQVVANTNLDYGLITSAATTTFDYGALS